MKFADLGLSEPVLRAVAAQGYTTPTPIQARSIPHLLTGQDVLGCAQTGTGKTAAYALPILHRLHATHTRSPHRRPIRVLVVAPTRELAGQIGDDFRTYGKHTAMRHTVVVGGVPQGSQVRALRQGVDVLVATPGRLVDLAGQGVLRLNSIESFVIDEADRLLDMGFLPDLKRVIEFLPERRQTVMFSATMPSAIVNLAQGILCEPTLIRLAPEQSTTDLIDQSVCFVASGKKTSLLVELLGSKKAERVIVFTRTKHGANRVAKQLNEAGIRAEAMHGNKSQGARQRTLASFRSRRPPVLVATDLAARGIDVDNVSHVFNYDMPHEPETYVHRIGRTGRAGARGVAVSFCDGNERSQLRAIERLIRQPLIVDLDMPVHLANVSKDSSGAGGVQRSRPGGSRRNERSTKPPAHRQSRVEAGQGRKKRKPGAAFPRR